MHPHLFTDDNIGSCEQVMQALDECHAKGFLYRCTGACNDAKTAVNKCLRAARLERTAANREKAKKERERIKKIWDDVDANS